MAKTQSNVYFPVAGSFLNRAAELDAVDVELDRLWGNPKHFVVCQVTGFGGMGKSRLLRELESHATKSRRRHHHVAFVSLELEPSATEVGALLSLREQLDIGCYLFDAALVRYWKAVGQPFSPIGDGHFANSLAAKGIETAARFGPFPIPISFAAEMWSRLDAKAKKRQRYKKSEFTAIDQMHVDPQRLRERLPGYLALDVKRTLSVEAQSLVVFYDSYDKEEQQAQERGEWLQDFIWTLGRGVHVISSRDSFHWGGQWRGRTKPVPVPEMPEQESRKMFRARLGELQAPIEDHLLEVSEQNPFFIESVISVYQDLAAEKTEIDLDDLPSSPEGAVNALLDHRRTPQRALATALATVQVFDRKLYEHLAYVLSVELGILHYRDFVESFIVEALDERLSRTHDLLTKAVRLSPEDASIREVALKAATNHLLARCEENGHREHQAVLGILRGIIEGWGSVEAAPDHSIETLIDAGYILHDAGFSNELQSIVASAPAAFQPSIAAASTFFEALASRRTAGVDAAIERFERVKSRGMRLGRHRHSVDLELAYLRELGGNYFQAREEFKQLAEETEPFNPTDRAQLRARLYYADILIMDGDFREGSRVLQEAYDAVGYREIVNWGELVRHRGHAYRFSFLLEDAANLYLLALRKTPEAPGMTAKLHTNLAEAYCWYEPAKALEKARVSIDLHQRSGNQIELAKCYAAVGIAHARQRNFEDAADAIREAKKFANAAGYPAAFAFALQAEAVSKGLAEDQRNLTSALRRLQKKTDELGTYRHLCVAPLVLAGSEDAFEEASSKFEWFEPETLGDRLRAYLKR